jgi:hypothetical protein
MKTFLMIAFISFLFLTLANSQNSNQSQTTQSRDIQEITTSAELTNYLIQHPNNTFLFIGENNSKDYSLVVKAVPLEVNMIWSRSEELMSQFSVPSGQSELVYFKYSRKVNKHREGVRINLASKRQKLKFIKIAVSLYLNPSVEIVNDNNVDTIMYPGYPSLMVINKEKSNTVESNRFKEILSKLEKIHRGRLMFYLCNYDEGQNSLLISEVFHINSTHLPSAVIIDGLNSTFSSELKKINFVGNEVTYETMQEFIDDYLNYNIRNSIISEELPEKPVDEHGVWKIVTKNVDSIIENSKGKDIVVFSCIDSRDCNVVKSRIRNLALKTAKTSTLIVGELNPKKNEIDSIYVNKIPSIIIFPDSPNRVKSRVYYRGSFTTKDILSFVRKNAKHAITETRLNDEENVYRNEYKYMVKQVPLHQDEYEEALKKYNISKGSNETNPEIDALRQLVEDEELSGDGDINNQQQDVEEGDDDEGDEPFEEENHKKDDL